MSEVFRRASSSQDADDETWNFEIFVQPGFSNLELSSVITALQAANETGARNLFRWQITSDQPGLVSDHGNMAVRAEPAIGDQYLKDCLLIIGGKDCNSAGWMGRLRAMQRIKRPAVLFSDAATEYIRTASPILGPVTTHWKDATILRETGDYPSLSNHLVENNKGVLTCAGRGHTMEVVLGLLAEILSPQQMAEMTAALLIDDLRGFQREQPQGLAHNTAQFERRLKNAIKLMEENVEHPLKIVEVSEETNVSTRQLERLFKLFLGVSPARFYKQLRVKRAYALVTETRMPALEVALACGFSSASSLSSAFRQEYGVTPMQIRRK